MTDYLFFGLESKFRLLKINTSGILMDKFHFQDYEFLFIGWK
jgi:hypothetical protein